MTKRKEKDFTEKHIEKQVTDYARNQGFLCRKYNSPSTAAVPDHLYWGYGQHFLIEFKRRGEKPRPAQRREIERLQDHGAKVFVVDNIELGKSIIDGARIVGESCCE